MSADIPTTVPGELRAGDTWKWTVTLADYPASAGWSVTWRFRNAAGGFEATAAASGDDHAVTLAAATTAAFAAGTYAWAAQAAKAGEKYTVDTGTLLVNPDVFAGTASAAYDARSHARIVLDAVEAVLENRATLDQESYEIAGRALKRTPLQDLLKLRQHYLAAVQSEEAEERIRRGTGTGRRIQFR